MHNLNSAKYIFFCIFCSFFLPIGLYGQASKSPVYNHQAHKYTKNNPLVVEGLWSLWPLSYINEEGSPTGIDIDITKHILNKLNIPYVIRLKYREDVINDLHSGKAQLSWGTSTQDNKKYFIFSEQSITYLVHAVAYRKGETHITNFEELKNAKVIIHNGSGSQDILRKYGWTKNALTYEDMKKAMYDLSNRNADFIVWNSLGLEYLKGNLHFDSIEIRNIQGMQPSAYKFMGTDSALIAKLDSVFAKEHADGNLSYIYDKWFYNNSKHIIPKWIIFSISFIAFIFVILLIFNFIYRKRINDQNKRISLLDGRLALAIKSGNIMLWIYDVKEKKFLRIDSKEDIKNVTEFDNFTKFIKENKSNNMEHNFNMLIDGKRSKFQDIVIIDPSYDCKMKVYQVVANVLERNKYGKVTTIIGTNKDITEHYQREVEEKDIMLKYKTIFNSAMVAISYINSDGVYVDVNERWCRYFNIKNKKEFLDSRPTIKEIWGNRYESLESKNNFWAATAFNLPAAEETTLRYAQQQRNVIIENRMVAIYDNNSNYTGCSSSFIDITDDVKSFREVDNYVEKTRSAMNDIKIYADNINHVLKSCGIRIFWLSKNEYSFRISNDANNIGKEFRKDAWMNYLTNESKAKAESIIKKIRDGFNDIFSINIEIYRHNKNSHYNFIGLPEFENNGNIKNFFGLAINISELAEAQNNLEKKKKEAQKADVLKSAFLKNMSFEIRTPLQAVVGFSELLSDVKNKEDESFFVNEIKRNSNLLLKIVNDVLFLSKLDAGMIDVKKEKCDISILFKQRCYVAKKKLENARLNFIEDCDYNKYLLEIDYRLITIIIDNLLDNAIKYTKYGHISAKYKYEEGYLIIFIEDTGCGIPEKMIGKIFNKFVKTSNDERGSGLGLSFCKVIAELMDGNIHIESKENYGTTAWVRIPCRIIPIKEMEVV